MKKKLGGRPRIKKDAKIVNFRLGSDTIKMLEILAENGNKFKSNKTQVVEELINEAYYQLRLES